MFVRLHLHRKTFILVFAIHILAFIIFPCCHPPRFPSFPFLFLPRTALSSVPPLFLEHNENKSISLHSRLRLLQRTLESIVVERTLQDVKGMLFKLNFSSDFLSLTDGDFIIVSCDRGCVSLFVCRWVIMC